MHPAASDRRTPPRKRLARALGRTAQAEPRAAVPGTKSKAYHLVWFALATSLPPQSSWQACSPFGIVWTGLRSWEGIWFLGRSRWARFRVGLGLFHSGVRVDCVQIQLVDLALAFVGLDVASDGYWFIGVEFL